MTQSENTADSGLIIVYDGHCNLCNRSLQFVLRHSARGQFTFISFQSEQGQVICDHFGIEFDESTSMLVIEAGELHTESRAWQKILGRLSLRYRILALLMRILPTGLNDRVYRFIGARRYRWFGRSAECRLIDPTTIPESDAIQKQLQSSSNRE